MEKQYQHIKEQFQKLLDRAEKRFCKLRELQAPGSNLWSVVQAYYHKTFRAYSVVWQYQLQNRMALLESGLQRADFGGIASKIGQLYYNYYLRSGDAGALLESYTFYDAIHTRQYFAVPAGVSDPAAEARQLRFYARFTIVCLFLNRIEEAVQLSQELQACVSAYTLHSSPADAGNWRAVLEEVSGLVGAHVAAPLRRSPASTDTPFRPTLRCSPVGAVAACAPHRSCLREAILVSYRPRQIKVAELPLELYRMAQALEWQDARLGGEGQCGADLAGFEPCTKGGGEVSDLGSLSRWRECRDNLGNLQINVQSSHPASAHTRTTAASDCGGNETSTPHAGGLGAPLRSAGLLRSPPRQLLHRPTAQQLLRALLAVCGPGGASSSSPASPSYAPGEELLLLYIAADAAQLGGTRHLGSSPSQQAASGDGLSVSGEQMRHSPRQLLLCPASQHGQAVARAQAPGSAASDFPQLPSPLAPPDCLLHPEELLSATRRPLLLVLDSDMGPDFARLQGLERGHPLLCLMSPSAPLPAPLGERLRHAGSLTTLALTCPAAALCVMCGQMDAPPEKLRRLQAVINGGLERLGAQMAEQLLQISKPLGADTAERGRDRAAKEAGALAADAAHDRAYQCNGVGSTSARESASWALPYRDILTRRLVLHFAFFRCCMAMYSLARAPDWKACLPSCFPPLPPAADADDEALRSTVLRSAELLGAQMLFQEGAEASLQSRVPTHPKVRAE